MKNIILAVQVAALCLLSALTVSAQQTTFQFSTANRGPEIGPLHYGIFYEEINHAGDGGIYAELIRNGSMEENSSKPDYWQTVEVPPSACLRRTSSTGLRNWRCNSI